MWRVGTGTGISGEGWGEEGDGAEADGVGGRRRRKRGVVCGLWGHLGLGRTQMSGGFTVFSN